MTNLLKKKIINYYFVFNKKIICFTKSHITYIEETVIQLLYKSKHFTKGKIKEAEGKEKNIKNKNKSNIKCFLKASL